MDHRHRRHFIWTLHHQQSLLVLLYWLSLLLYRQVARAFKVQECCSELMMLAAVNCSLTDANLTFCCCNLTKYAWSWADSNCMTNKATTRHYPLKINIIYIPHLTSPHSFSHSSVIISPANTITTFISSKTGSQQIQLKLWRQYQYCIV